MPGKGQEHDSYPTYIYTVPEKEQIAFEICQTNDRLHMIYGTYTI